MEKFLGVVLEMTMNALAKITFSCKRMARHGIAFPFRAVIGLAALSLLNCVAFGQPFSGPGVFSGNAQFIMSPSGGGGPLTYAAVTDQCELGTETYCASGLPLPFLYCNTGAYSAGSTFTPVNTAPCPVANGGTAPNIGGLTGAGTIITEPYFNSKVVRVTDNATQSASTPCPGAVYNNFSDGVPNGWASDSSKFLATSAGGVVCVFAFSADSFMTPAPSSINGSSGTACSANCTNFLTGASVTFSFTNPNQMVEASSSTGAINSLIISACSPSIGTCTTNVAPTVANAANWVFSRTLIFNFLTGCSGQCGLPSAFVPNWIGTLLVSEDNSTIAFALSDDGQNLPNWSDGTHMCPQPAGTTVTKYGPSFIFAYKIAVGWRTYNTCGFLGINGDAPYIQGSFGDTGSPTDGTCSSGCDPDGMQPVGTSGGSLISDFMSLHNGSVAPDYHYFTMAAVVADGSLPGSCGGHICANQPYYWEISTTNMRYGTCNAHNIKGYKYLFGGGLYTACSYHNPNSPTPPNGLNLIATGAGIDDHGTGHNLGTLDYQPITASTTNVCDQSGTPGGSPTGTFPTGPCKTYATGPWWNEIIMVENSVGNYTNAANAYGKHCNYGHGVNGDACVYRMGQHYNTGTSPYFGTASAIPNIDPTGRYALFVSDWWLTLGCSNGVASGCLDPVSAGNSATTPTISAVAVDSAGTIATITVANTSPVISTGMYPSFSGLGNATFLNGNYYFVKSFSGTQFTVCAEASGGAAACTVGGIGHASYSGSETTGTATWGSCTTKYLFASCPRSDLFVMDLVSAHATPAGGGALSVLNSTRAINWQRANVGVPGGIPTTWTQCGSTLPSSSSAATINAALAACGANQYVLLGAGTFNLTTGIMMNALANVELRGSGPTQTILAFTGNVTCFSGGAHICIKNSNGLGDSSANVLPPCGSTDFNCADWTAGYTQGATSITVGNVGLSGIHNGDVIILDQQNDSTDNGGFLICDQTSAFVCQDSTQANHELGRIIGGVAYAQQQQVVVTAGCATACTGTGPFTLTITPGLYANNWHGGSRPVGIWFVFPTTNVGVRNLTIDNSGDAQTSPHWGGILFYNCYGCWVKNVRSISPNRNHVWIYNSARNEVRDSYFYGTQGGVSQSYGVEEFPAHDTLVENNIFQQITGSPANGTGNVWAYNFSIDNAFYPQTWMQGTYISHDNGNTFSLWEGNQLNALFMDQLHGTSGLNTVFRNRINGRDYNTCTNGSGSCTNFSNFVNQPTVQTYPLDFDAYSRGMNVIGNVLGTPSYHTQYEAYPPSSGVPNCNVSIYTLGWGGAICGTGVHNGVLDDTVVRNTLMRWGNWDAANNAVRWDNAESSPGAVTYIGAQSTPASHTLPASFYLSAKPSWWGTMPYPAIGPDVSGGTGPGGFSYNIPAANCYYSVMSGPTDGSGSVLSFDASNCY